MIIPIVCWGPHVDLAKYCLNSLNLQGHRVIVYTDVKFPGYETRPLPQGRTKHERTTAAFKDALTLGPICPIAPDMVASRGLLQALERHLDKELVVLPVVRVDSKILPIERDLTSRDLAKLALNFQHDRQKLQFLDKIPTHSNPTNVFQRKGNTLSVRAFHLHPILINTKDLNKISAPIDDYMVTRFKRIHIVQDSDEMMVVDLTPADYDWNKFPIRFPVKTEEFIHRKCNKTHRWFFEHECFIHSEGIEKPDPDPRIDALLKLSRETPQRWTG